MTIEKYLIFLCNYTVESGFGLLGMEKERKYYFPGHKLDGGKDGLRLKIKPYNAEGWIGIFSSNFGIGIGKTAICSCSEIDSLCVVSDGTAYFGKASSPKSFKQINKLPVIDIFQDIGNKFILFVDYHGISIYGINDEQWLSPRISWDGFKDLTLINGIISGLSRDPSNKNQEWVPFSLDLKKRELNGGSYPKYESLNKE